MNVKKAMILVVFTIFASFSSAYAENTVEEYPEHMEHWSHTYEAFGRTIDVDIPIIGSEIDEASILEVSIVEPINKATIANSNDTMRIKQSSGGMVELEDCGLIPYLNHTEGYATIWLNENSGDILVQSNNSPNELRKYGNGKFLWTINQSFYPYEVDPKKIFAEDNPISLESAEDILSNIIAYFYGGKNESIAINYFSLKSRAKKKGELVSQYPMGTYEIHFMQEVDGLPVLGKATDIYDIYALADNKVYTDEIAALGTMDWWTEIMSGESFILHALMLEKKSVVEENVSLAPVSQIISSLETEINEGRIRDVYSLRLGYICYRNDNDETYLLYPVWVCECEYVESPDMRESEYPEDGSFRSGSGFAKVGIDARNAKLINRMKPTKQSLYTP